MNSNSWAKDFCPQKLNQLTGRELYVTRAGKIIPELPLLTAIHGPTGSSKTTFGKLIAKASLCTHTIINERPCGACSSCKEIASEESDFNPLNKNIIRYIDGGIYNKVDDIRYILEDIRYHRVRPSVTVIDNFHNLSQHAKILLREPTKVGCGGTRFIYITSNINEIPIENRSQINTEFQLAPFDTESIKKHLLYVAGEMGVWRNCDDLIAVDQVLNYISKNASGNIEKAVNVFQQVSQLHDMNPRYDVLMNEMQAEHIIGNDKIIADILLEMGDPSGKSDIEILRIADDILSYPDALEQIFDFIERAIRCTDSEYNACNTNDSTDANRILKQYESKELVILYSLIELVFSGGEKSDAAQRLSFLEVKQLFQSNHRGG